MNMALPKRIITIAYAGLEKHAWKIVIQNRLLWNFQYHQQCHQEIPAKLNRQPFSIIPEDMALEVYNHTSADIIRSILEVLIHAE